MYLGGWWNSLVDTAGRRTDGGENMESYRITSILCLFMLLGVVSIQALLPSSWCYEEVLLIVLIGVGEVPKRTAVPVCHMAFAAVLANV